MDQFVTRGTTTTTPRNKRSMDEADSTPKSAKKLRQTLLDNNIYSNLKDDDKGDNNHTQNKKKPRLPPIVLYSELANPKDTYSKIQSWVKNPVHFKKQSDRRLVYTTDKEDFEVIKAKFRELNFDWHGHKSQDDIPNKLVLKGIDIAYTKEEILSDLKSQYEHVVDVRQMNKRNERGEKIPIAVYVVYFTWNTRLSVVKKMIQYCCLHRIKWEFLRKNNSNKLNQCHNCQFFGHHQSECGRNHRCVKCDIKHSPGKCNKVREVDAPVCCNCKGNHPANYKGCVKIKEYLKNERPSTTRNQPKKTPSSRNNGVAFQIRQQPQQGQVRRQLTYSNAVRNGGLTDGLGAGASSSGLPTSRPISRGLYEVSANANSGSRGGLGNGGFAFITNEINSLFGMSFVEVMSTVNAFLPKYDQCQDVTQKKLLLIEFLIVISNKV